MTKKQPYLKFKGFLVENNIQQKEVAKILNISNSTLNKKINGTGSDFTIQEAKKICQTLNTNSEIFFA